MKTRVMVISALLIGILVFCLGPAPSPPASTMAAGFDAPTMAPITASFYRPITTYVENATPAPGDSLTFTWSKDLQRNCGVFAQAPTAHDQATWSHPDASLGGNCPDENAHPGLITVVVTDGQWVCTAIYPLGSAPGIGPQPAPCLATPAPTMTNTPAPTSTAFSIFGTNGFTPTLVLTPTTFPSYTPTAIATATTTATPTSTVTPSDTDTPTDTDTPVPVPVTAPPPIEINTTVYKNACPVVFVPGILGSVLWKDRGLADHKRGVQVWPPASIGNKSVMDTTQFLKDFSTTLLTSDWQPDDTGRSEGTLFPTAYDQLIRYFHEAGYIDTKNFWVFNYNWTQSNQISGQKLVAKLNQWAQAYESRYGVKNVKFCVMDHSMGGLVVREAALLEKKAKQVNIGAISQVDSPEWGSPKAYLMLQPLARAAYLSPGYGWIVDWLSSKLLGVTGLQKYSDAFDKGVETLKSAYELLPDEFYFEAHSPVAASDKVVCEDIGTITSDVICPDTWAEAYTQHFMRFGEPTAAVVTAAMAFKHNLGISIRSVFNGPYEVIAGPSYDTISHIDCVRFPITPTRSADCKAPQANEAGDGTVVLSSQKGKEKVFLVRDADHSAVPNEETTFAVTMACFVQRQCNNK